MKLITSIILAGIALALFTGCQTQEDQVQRTQDRKLDMMMKQMQRQQAEAEKSQR
ncbi:MAG: hypothetical protein WDM76_17155 [Limisphaerales bacterium]